MPQPRSGKLAWLRLFCVLSLANIAAGPPVLSGTAPGSLVLYPEDVAAHQEARRVPDVSAAAALLADSTTGQPLLVLNPDQPRPMASTTKIMTALLALERGNLADQVVVSPTALVGEASMGLQAGEVVTVEDLLWGLLLNSGNDAAMALAEYVAGSEADFVVLMNQRAAELGLRNTRFANPHGLDAPDHYSSARDLWRLAEAAMAYPKFREIVATQAHTAAGHPLWTQNELLGAYPGADGIKTGTTELAGQSLVASVTHSGHRAVAAILGSQDRYTDARALFDAYFDRFRWSAAPGPAGETAWVRADDGRVLRVTVPQPPDLFLPAWLWPQVRTQVVLDDIPLDLSQPAGEVRWYLGNELLGRAPALLSGY
jgi:D-alanyl-D-alanine carboxypeptidase (penicillin-binding protein 5/6)